MTYSDLKQKNLVEILQLKSYKKIYNSGVGFKNRLTTDGKFMNQKIVKNKLSRMKLKRKNMGNIKYRANDPEAILNMFDICIFI